jgi:hypothetical protein
MKIVSSLTSCVIVVFSDHIRAVTTAAKSDHGHLPRRFPATLAAWQSPTTRITSLAPRCSSTGMTLHLGCGENWPG